MYFRQFSVLKKSTFLCVGAFYLISCSNSNPSNKEASSSDSDDSWVGECDPGDRKECDCDGVPGIALCRANGAWSACECDSDLTEDTDEGDASAGTDTDGEETFTPPDVRCPDGTVEFNIRDIWSSKTSATLNRFSSPPRNIMISPSSYTGEYYGAKLGAKSCDWYTACLPVSTASVVFKALNPETECTDGTTASAPFDLSEYTTGAYSKLWMSYKGSDIEYDYTQAGWQGENPIGENAFDIAVEMDEENEYDPESCMDFSGFKVLHIRWPWSDSTVTGLSGSACEDEQAGIETPAYPEVLRVTHDSCTETLAVLERQDQLCPWYRLLIPEDAWSGGSIQLTYPDQSANLFTPTIPLPETSEDQLWLVYEGAPDDDSNPSGGNCMNWSQRSNVYHFYTSNLGPYYPSCGGEPVPEDSCNDIKPVDRSIVHFRYIWAGRKTFTYFPSPKLMPTWMVLEVNGGGGDNDVICWREADSPWFRCPVPNTEFYEGASWRAVDKTRDPEWNTVSARGDFPSEPGNYWLRWTYGKPDIPETSEFEFTDYYPDGVEWAATGDWGADFCFSSENVDRPEIQSDGYFPWNETNYEYGFGQSVAKWYDEPDTVQTLLNYLVYERYVRWKSKYIVYDSCAPGTARVNRPDYSNDTVSEGQGYGMAVAAAVGDKELFDQLLRFVKYYLSQYEGKYCGGLMGWKWSGESDCRTYNEACNIEEGACGDNGDSAFDGDVDIGIGLLYAAWQWPEYTDEAVDWLLKMECEVNTAYDGTWYYPAPGDSYDKSCTDYPNEPCSYLEGYEGTVNMSYYPPGYFRVFGDFLMNKLDPTEYTVAERRNHRDFWHKTADTVWEMTERCYDNTDINPALYTDWGTYSSPCASQSDNYNWSRALWRVAVDVAWYGDEENLSVNREGSSSVYPSKAIMQAKMDLIQDFYANTFPQNNPPEENANRFSTICRDLQPDGLVADCDPAYDHNSYFVNTAMCAFATFYDNDGLTTDDIRREALEEAVSVSIQNNLYYQESIGIYTLLFLTGNFPKPFSTLYNAETPII